MRRYRHCLILISLFLVHGICFSQSIHRNLIPGYLDTKQIKNPNYPYLSFYNWQNGELIEAIMYYKNRGQYILAYFQGNPNRVTEKISQGDSIFTLINKNMKNLKKLLKSRFLSSWHLKGMKDTSGTLKRIAIRYKSLHFNHFYLEDARFINGLPNEEFKKAHIALHSLKEQLYAVIEKQILN